jgi:hypothetical protein
VFPQALIHKREILSIGWDMKKSDERWCMGWQSPAGTPIETVLEDSIKRFLEKWFVLPELVYVNPSVELKAWGNIPLKRDRSMYCPSIVLLMIPKAIEIQK